MSHANDENAIPAEKARALRYKCHNVVYKYIKLRKFPSIFDADDLVQELCMKFIRRGDYDPDVPLIIKIAKERLIEIWRREGRWVDWLPVGEVSGWLRTPSSVENAIDEYNLFQLWMTSGELEVMRFFEAQTMVLEPGEASEPPVSENEEIAAALGTSPGAAEKQRSRVRQKIRTLQEELRAFTQARRRVPRKQLLASFDATHQRLMRAGLADEYGWLVPAGAAQLVGVTHKQIIKYSRHGWIDGWRVESAGGLEWFYDPDELRRWLSSSQRRTMRFNDAMAEIGQGWRLRRAAWASARGLRAATLPANPAFDSDRWELVDDSRKSVGGPRAPEKTRAIYLPDGIGAKQLSGVAPDAILDITYRDRSRIAAQGHVIYSPTPEDCDAMDWFAF